MRFFEKGRRWNDDVTRLSLVEGEGNPPPPTNKDKTMKNQAKTAQNTSQNTAQNKQTQTNTNKHKQTHKDKTMKEYKRYSITVQQKTVRKVDISTNPLKTLHESQRNRGGSLSSISRKRLISTSLLEFPKTALNTRQNPPQNQQPNTHRFPFSLLYYLINKKGEYMYRKKEYSSLIPCEPITQKPRTLPVEKLQYNHFSDSSPLWECEILQETPPLEDIKVDISHFSNRTFLRIKSYNEEVKIPVQATAKNATAPTGKY